MRLFVALWPSAEANARCDALVTDIPGARWVRPEQRHLTLRFLGEIDEATREATEAAIAERVARWPAMTIRLRGLDTFGRRRPRVLFAKVQPEDEVVQLAGALEEACVSAGVAPETRPFQAHLTLARLKRVERGPLRALLRAHEAFETEPFDVRSVDLVSSELSPSGATYQTLRRFSLGGVTPDASATG